MDKQTLELMAELLELTNELERNGGVYQLQANRIQEITKILSSKGLIESEDTVSFAKEIKH